MNIRIADYTARSAVFDIEDGGIYQTEKDYELYLNGTFTGKADKVIFPVYGLEPDTFYKAELKRDGALLGEISFQTEKESVTLNVREFGAAGDEKKDDTLALQTAILSCPQGGRVLIPRGIYRFVCLFLKSHIRLELEEGAELSAVTDREAFPYFPGTIEGTDGQVYQFGTWEGTPAKMFAGILTGMEVEDVKIYGKGAINGNASHKNWWHNCTQMVTAWRPRTVFFNHCNNISMIGVTVKNSPSWTIHPYFCENMKFLALEILNPKDSHNTDGLDPESCCHVELAGIHFSVGDDCIAIKSGKIDMGKTYKTPCEDILIRQCSMNDGHGSVVLGSEIGAGVRHLTVKDCIFNGTDRGLRIKTRRGRGEDCVVDDVVFENIKMNHVLTPFVVNCFYFCDPDGKSDYVQSKESLPVDERTPDIRKLSFKKIEAKNAAYAAVCAYGLPEQKIGCLEFENISVTYDKTVMPGVPAMMCGMDPMKGAGIFVRNVKILSLKQVHIEGCEEPVLDAAGVEKLIEE